MNKRLGEIREYIACPQLGDKCYGKWGALTVEQRIVIKELIDYIRHLEEDLEKAYKIITDDRKFNGGRMLDLANYMEENKKLRRRNEIMGDYLELIYDIGYDYDGFNKSEDLKKVIDELVRFASLGLDYNTTEVIYENRNKKYNILHEEIKGDGNE